MSFLFSAVVYYVLAEKYTLSTWYHSIGIKEFILGKDLKFGGCETLLSTPEERH
jgi:hypothetical protein